MKILLIARVLSRRNKIAETVRPRVFTIVKSRIKFGRVKKKPIVDDYRRLLLKTVSIT